MKKLYILLFSLFISVSANAQCVATVTVNNGSCDSLCSGLVMVQMTGGALPITLYLDDGTTQLGPFTVTSFWQYGNLCPGNYTIIATDMNGDTCTGNTSFSIISTPQPDAIITVTNATCTSCPDGAATAAVTGGTPPYNYNWSNGATGGSVCCLTPGLYTLHVVDANGCWDLDTFLVSVGSIGSFLLAGHIYYDLNQNGTEDVGEPALANQPALQMPGNVTAFTNFNGHYAFAAMPGPYDVSYAGVTGWQLTSSPSTYSVIVSGTAVDTLDFGVFPDSTDGSAVVSLYSGLPRCLVDVPYYLMVNNNGFTILDGAVTFTYDADLTFVSSSVVPVSHVGNVLTYNYSGLFPGQAFGVIVVFTEPAGGTALLSTVDVTGSDTFGNQLSYTQTLGQVVACSFDPNDKSVQPVGLGGGNYVAMNTWLDYLVRFQNTGTDTAFTVVIRDTLDADLDAATFMLLGYSHPVQVSLRPGNELEFAFSNILLVDSNANEPASHGYVQYRIKGYNNNPDPTEVTNTAYIYFDLNSPVETNSTLTTFSDNWLFVENPDGTENLFELFPNPAHDAALLRLKTPGTVNYTVTITDVRGRIVFGPEPLENGSLLLHNDKWQPGIYLVEARPIIDGKPVYMRLVKQ